MNCKSFFFGILVSSLCFLSSCADTHETVVPVESIMLDKEMLLIEENKDAQFIVTIEPSDATDRRIEWTSEDGSVATVSKEGVLTALKPGKTTVTAIAKEEGMRFHVMSMWRKANLPPVRNRQQSVLYWPM